MVRTGSIQKLETPSSGIRVGKIVKKVKRTNRETGEELEACLFKLHYNGSFYLAPTEAFETATKEDRKQDKRNAHYWRNEHQSLTGAITWAQVEAAHLVRPQQWFDL